MVTNAEILSKYNKAVYGHESTKKILINLVNRSQFRYLQIYRDRMAIADCIELYNCLLIGSSGTGKTYLLETLASIMPFPFIKFDASLFNPIANRSTWSVEKVEKEINNYIENVYTQNNKDPSSKFYHKYFSVEGAMHQTIVFIDEFDKMCKEYSDSAWKEGTQGEFLTLFGNKRSLKGITYIFAGAFTGIAPNINTGNMGFNVLQDKSELDNKGIKELDQKLMNMGVIPEILGRIGVISELTVFNIKDYLYILETQLLPKLYKTLKQLNITSFKISDKEKRILAEKAKESGLGIRGLKRELASLLVDLEFDALSYGESIPAPDMEQEDSAQNIYY